MDAQLDETATDRVYGPPMGVTVNPGDAIVFDKRLVTRSCTSPPPARAAAPHPCQFSKK